MKKESLKENPLLKPFRRRSDTDRSVEPAPGEAELRMAIEAAELGIFDYYPLTGELHWSHRTKEHFGLSPDAHVNYNVFLVGLHPDDRDRIEKIITKAMRRENNGKYGMEYRTIGIEDGKERWIAAHGQAFFNHTGDAVRVIGTTQDITEHKRADEDLKRAVQELERASRELEQFRKTTR